MGKKEHDKPDKFTCYACLFYSKCKYIEATWLLKGLTKNVHKDIGCDFAGKYIVEE